MYIKANASRRAGIINVLLNGELPTPCDQAEIVDIYPGGSIMYITDPDEAQVFIKEGRKPGLENSYCIQISQPWINAIDIPDNYHQEVSILVNDELVDKVEIEEYSG